MKRGIKRGLSLVLLLILFSNLFNSIVYAEILESNYYEVLSESDISIIKTGGAIIKPSEINIDNRDGVKLLSISESMDYGEETIFMAPQSSLSIDFSVAEAGGYHIIIDYYIPEATMENLNIALEINGEFQFYESRNIKLPAVWRDKTKDYKQDSYGNDSFPSPERVYKWQTAALNTHIYNLSTPFIFCLNAGKNTITIENNDVEMMIGNIIISPQLETLTYSQYKETNKDKTVIDRENLVIQGEDYSEKSESYIRGGKSNNYNMYPYHPVKKKINHLGSRTWESPGESVTYYFDVEKDGLYKIHFKYNQEDKKDLPIFKRIYINGEVPFTDFNAYAFPFTGTKLKNETLTVEGEEALIYLQKGINSITLESTASPHFETYENLLYVINSISDIALQIKLITGNKVDKNRDWAIGEYIPTLSQDLLKGAQILDDEYEKLSRVTNKTDSYILSSLKVSVDRLKIYANNPDKLVNNLDQFSYGGSSVSQQIALILPELLRQPLAIDCIFVTGINDELPSPTVGPIKSIGEEVKKLFLSFTDNHEVSQDIHEDKLNVWVNRSIPHIEVLREKVENEFTAETGIKVNISTMPDEQKLLLANSAGKAPDAVLGASSYRPFDFALRGALYDLREFDDFGEFIKDYPPETFIPFTIGDSCYAIPETANFNVLFYRKDILDKLKLEVPDTWGDVVKILPELSRYGMTFNTMIANVGGLKHFGATIPFIQQFEGKIYSPDGSKVKFGDPNTIKAFKFMTDLYTRYSLPENIASFYNNFRYGVTPIGMSDFNTYILLKNAAPEIIEQWGIAPGIGVRDEKNQVLRYQPAINTSCLIMKTAKEPNHAWKLIKWWMDTNTQVTYANEMQLRYGPEYIWNTANLEAFAKSSAIDEKDKKVILKQYEYIKEIPRNPAYFAVERELSNAWNKVVFDGMSPRIAIDQAITLSNREISKKLKEFGYMDNQGNMIRPFETITPEKIESWKE